MPGIGRNQPCPCGSGKKYKRCCGQSSDELPDPQAMQANMARQMQAVNKLLQEQDFESVEEANAFLQDLLTQESGIPFTPETPQDQAQELVYQAWETTNLKQRQRLARQALKIDSDCADAYVLLAESVARGPEEARDLYQKGVEAGERSLGPEAFEEHAGYFWGLIETRPYMRARQGLAQVLWALGDVDGAIVHYRDMLRLNPNDNQGLRYELLDSLLSKEDLEGVEELLSRYEGNFSARWLFTSALVSFLREGDTSESRDELAAAMEVNPYVSEYLLGKTKLPRRPPDTVGFGDRNEAIEYAASSLKLWRRHPRALEWLEATQELETLDTEGIENGNGAAPYLPLDDEDDLMSDILVEDEEYTEPSHEEWSALYLAAMTFNKQAPWRWMDDTVFAVEDPASGETGYCVVMGGGGYENGLAVFVGEEGLESYRKIESGEVNPESVETAATLRSLSVTYGSRSDLDEEELNVIRSLGLRFRGKRAWPLPRSLRPGWMPRSVNQDEARFLTTMLEQVVELCAHVRDEGLELHNEEDDYLVLTRYRTGDIWQEEWRRLPDRASQFTLPEPPDSQRLRELGRAAGKPSGTWEMDMFPLSVPVPADSGRLYFPTVAIAMERSSGVVYGADVVGPAPGPTTKQEIFIRILERAHHIPRNLRVATEDMRSIVGPVANMLGMSVRVGVLPGLEEAKQAFEESLMAGEL